MRLPVICLAAALVLGASPPEWNRSGNRILLPTTEGHAELEWVSSASFRFVRDWRDSSTGPKPMNLESVDLEGTDTETSIVLRSRLLSVRIRKNDLRMQVDGPQGLALLHQIEGSRLQQDGVVFEQIARPKESYFGLGAGNVSGTLDLRGQVISTNRPCIISSAGYGLFLADPAQAEFDLAKTDPGRARIVVKGSRIEAFFHYGPAPKEILEQHLVASPLAPGWRREDLGLLRPSAVPVYATSLAPGSPPSGEMLRSTLVRMLHAAFSGQPAPVFDLNQFESAPEDLRRRAEALAVFAPLVAGREPGGARIMDQRRRFRPFLEAYFQELFDRGFPIFRPLLMQYPKDPETVNIADQFLFGDELLVAPFLTPAPRRQVYLPMGNWTDLRTNQVYPGRQTVELEAAGQALLFAKNGALVPFLRPDDTMEAHYFPRLGGEFFVYEPGARDYTQLHASPAGDLYRLEIESKTGRHYEWVVHHLPEVGSVVREGKPLGRVRERSALKDGFWYYDYADRGLYLRVQARTGENIIHNISFQ